MRMLPFVLSLFLLTSSLAQAADQEAAPTLQEKATKVWQTTSDKASEYGDVAAQKSKQAWSATKEKSQEIANKTSEKASEYSATAAKKSKQVGKETWQLMKKAGEKAADVARDGADKIRSSVDQ